MELPRGGFWRNWVGNQSCVAAHLASPASEDEIAALVHAAAWKEMFDDYLRGRAERMGEEFVPFDARHDYDAYVDGKPRYDGVRSFLQSRGIELPDGTPGFTAAYQLMGRMARLAWDRLGG